MHKKEIQIGIIGQGRSGRDIHGSYLKTASGKYRIAAISDPLRERRERAEKEYGCKAYEDYRDMLDKEKLDVVVNATPSHLHVPLTHYALEKGFNVVCEKPLSNNTAEIDMLIDAAGKSGKMFTVFQEARYEPAFCQVRKVVDSGVLGRVIQISVYRDWFARRWDWQTLKEFNGGNLLNLGAHELDKAMLLARYAAKPEVFCRMDCVNTLGDADDYLKLMLRAPGYPVVDLEISSCCAYPPFMYNIHGSNGSLTGTFSKVSWKYFKPEEAPSRTLIREPLSDNSGLPASCSEELKWYQEEWEYVEDEKEDLIFCATRDFYDMLYDSLAGDMPLKITPQQVRLYTAVIEECFRQNTQ